MPRSGAQTAYCRPKTSDKFRMPRPIFALIDTDAMAFNLRQVRRSATSSQFWAVVKANAYGHGIEPAVRGFQDADGLALLDFAEAQRARQSGWHKPILMLEGAFDTLDLQTARALDLSLVVHNAAGLQALERFCAHGPGELAVTQLWLKLNSGMNRLGFSLAQWQEVLDRALLLKSQGAVRELGVMSHFARADDEAGIERALAVWSDARQRAQLAGIERFSLANSAAVLRFQGAQSTWCRAGIALYGATPFAWESALEGSAKAASLQPAMGLYSQLIAVREIEQGEEIGYGGAFVAQRRMRIGVVACGYADGYPRVAPSGTPVLIDGIRCPTVGRVSMDMMTVDLGDAPQANLGTQVELWGKRLRIDEVASYAGTIGYELMCALAGRVPTSEGVLLG